MGGQDDFNQALDFVTGLGVTTPTMVWDPSFTTWRQYGIRSNSSMILASGDLTKGTEPLLGFNAAREQQIIDALDQFS